MTNIVLSHVSKTFGSNKVLSDVKLTVEEEEFFTFLGPSGCGKTTLLRIISGMIAPDAGGKIFFGDTDVTLYPPDKRNIGMVFQNYALFPHMDVFDNVAYGLRVRKVAKNELEKKVMDALAMVKMEDLLHRNIAELSGGQQQRVAIARALVIEPKIILFDEPMSNLDAKLREEMSGELRKLQKKLGITAIYVTHDQVEALSMSDRIAVFNQGVCQQISTPRELYDQPANAFVAGFIGKTNLFPITVKDGTTYIEGTDLKIEVSELRPDGTCISIRPECIQIQKENHRRANCISGIVAEVRFFGAYTIYEINWGNISARVKQDRNVTGQKYFQLGEEVYLYFTPENTIVLRA